MKKIADSLVVLALGLLASVQSLQAEDIFQSQSIASTSNWNEAVNWGGNEVIAENDYFSVPIGALSTAFTVNGTSWQYGGFLRDDRTNSSTFGGGSLNLVSNTAFLAKIEDGLTSTANIVFNGGFIRHAGNNSSNGDTGFLAGALSFADGVDLAAIGIQSAGNFTFDVASTIVGSSSKTLQLTLAGGDTRTDHLRLTGDLAAFQGMFYLENASTGAGSTLSIQSSAPLATVNMVTSSSNFLYDLTGDVTFGALILNGTPLTADTYDAAELNVLAPGAFLDGGGTITVVPEPTTAVLAAIGLLGAFSATRVLGRRKKACARS